MKRKIINKVSGVGESRSVGVERVASEVLYVLIAVRLFFSDATPPACVCKRVREGCYMREEIADEKLKCVSIKVENRRGSPCRRQPRFTWPNFTCYLLAPRKVPFRRCLSFVFRHSRNLSKQVNYKIDTFDGSKSTLPPSDISFGFTRASAETRDTHYYPVR